MRTEDQEFEDLEKKLDAETIDCRNQVTPEMRSWFMETYDHAADDCSVLARWNERFQK